MAWKIARNIRNGGYLKGYLVNNKYSTTASYGDTLTYSVTDSSGTPVIGQIWLEQYVNGALGYNGPFTVPMPAYTLTPKDQQGDWVSNAYTLVNGQKGSLIEQATLHVGGSALQTGTSAPGTPPPPSATFTPPPAAGGGPMPPPVPGTPGGAPAAGGGPTFGGSGCLNAFYRFILPLPDGSFATGSNRTGCSQTNSANCDPQSFATLQDALTYAASRGETPYQVLSAQEPWDLMACKIPVDPSRIIGGSGIPWYLWAVGAYVAYRLLK